MGLLFINTSSMLTDKSEIFSTGTSTIIFELTVAEPSPGDIESAVIKNVTSSPRLSSKFTGRTTISTASDCDLSMVTAEISLP